MIKVEAPTRPDLTRVLGPSPGLAAKQRAAPDGMSAMWMTANRGKRSLCLDLKSPAGLAVLLRLIPTSDVVVENFVPGVVEKLGCDYATLAAINPDLIMLSISGYGPSGR